MENELTITEIRFIRSLLAVKTDAQLADMLAKPVDVITNQIAAMMGIPKRPEEKKPKKEKPVKKKRITKSDRKLIRAQKIAAKEKKVSKRGETQSNHAMELERSLKRKRDLAKNTLPTRTIDLSVKVPIRLNAKTIVYVNPGTDIEKLKKQLKIKP